MLEPGNVTTFATIARGTFPSATDKTGSNGVHVTVRNVTIDKTAIEEADGDMHIYAHDATFARIVLEILPGDRPREGTPPQGALINVNGVPYCDTQHATESWHGSTCWELHPVENWSLVTSTTTTTSPTPSAPVSSAPQATSITASATASPSAPCQRSTETVSVTVTTSTGEPAPSASVSTSWHYKTTTSTQSATTDSNGHATISRGISTATAGYAVTVSVHVTWNGLSADTSTSFTPRAC